MAWSRRSGYIAVLPAAGRLMVSQIDVREGHHLARRDPHRIRHGLAFLTEDRRDEGLALEASIADNIALATLGTQYLGRSFGMWLTETRAMNQPDAFTQLASLRLLGVPLPLVSFAAVVLAAHAILTRTPFGRQSHAVGQDPVAARKAGLNVSAILAAVYVICGLCAGLGGAVSLAQIGSAAPTFGAGKEFAAIAAAVRGGTSLFGGRAQVLPGTVLGAVLIQSIENGLNNVNADPYLYPLVTSGIIFVAVLLDSLRSRLLARLGRRRIRNDQPRSLSSHENELAMDSASHWNAGHRRGGRAPAQTPVE